jgi:eukaryotic-like serine/threonine-protein kinase
VWFLIAVSLLSIQAGKGRKKVRRGPRRSAHGAIIRPIMTHAVGTRLGPYVIEAALDGGAMGEVYRARDVRLGRRVVVKTLPPHVINDAGRRARFGREARAVSHLAHPHICALHDVGEQDGVPFLIMEHLEGETLANRLQRGPLPMLNAIHVAMEIADALGYAHARGIVHRDLKPANLMLTTAGTKLLDFGLARFESALLDSGDAPGPEARPATETLTEEGAILGTVQYMAPEQLEGSSADGRSDIFALGAILYEMVTGRRAFEGTSKAGVIAAILERMPPPIPADDDSGGASVSLLNEAVFRCLAKRPDDRWQSANDFKAALGWLARGTAVPPRMAVPPSRRSARRVASAGASLLLLVVTLALTAVALRERAEVRDDFWFEITPPDQLAFNPAAASLALSPDGHHLVFVASSPQGGRALWLRPRNAVRARQLPGTEDAYQPFWSPDSRFIGFGAAGKLKTINLATNLVRTLTDAFVTTGTWNRAGSILFTPGPNERRLGDRTVQHVSADGGDPSALTWLDRSGGEKSHEWPFFLPGGRRFLFVVRSDDPTRDRMLTVGSLDSDRSVALFQIDSHAIYAAGHLLFLRGGRLVAQPFDPRSLKTTGEPAIIAGDVEPNDGVSRRGAFTASDNGVLAYRTGVQKRLAWFDRQGRLQAVLGETGRYSNPALSPDERRVAVERADPRIDQSDIWIIDVESGVASRFTDTGAEKPLWEPRTDRIIFRAKQIQGPFISRATRGEAPDEALLNDMTPLDSPVQALPDGRGLIYTVFDSSPTSPDLWMVPLTGDRTPVPVTSTPASEIDGQVSPDGRWLAYVSNEAGSYDVYVRPFPAGAAKWRISTGGGIEPVWRRDGRELFYLAADRSLMSVDVQTADTFKASAPVHLFQTRLATVLNTAYTRNQYAVSGDGQRFLLCEPAATPAPITVIVNWTARLRQR